MRPSLESRPDTRSQDSEQSSMTFAQGPSHPRRKANPRVIIALLVAAAAAAAVAASGMKSAEPVHTMPDGSTMDGGTMRR